MFRELFKTPSGYVCIDSEGIKDIATKGFTVKHSGKTRYVLFSQNMTIAINASNPKYKQKLTEKIASVTKTEEPTDYSLLAYTDPNLSSEEIEKYGEKAVCIISEFLMNPITFK